MEIPITNYYLKIFKDKLDSLSNDMLFRDNPENLYVFFDILDYSSGYMFFVPNRLYYSFLDWDEFYDILMNRPVVQNGVEYPTLQNILTELNWEKFIEQIVDNLNIVVGNYDTQQRLMEAWDGFQWLDRDFKDLLEKPEEELSLSELRLRGRLLLQEMLPVQQYNGIEVFNLSRVEYVKYLYRSKGTTRDIEYILKFFGYDVSVETAGEELELLDIDWDNYDTDILDKLLTPEVAEELDTNDDMTSLKELICSDISNWDAYVNGYNIINSFKYKTESTHLTTAENGNIIDREVTIYKNPDGSETEVVKTFTTNAYTRLSTVEVENKTTINGVSKSLVTISKLDTIGRVIGQEQFSKENAVFIKYEDGIISYENFNKRERVEIKDNLYILYRDDLKIKEVSIPELTNPYNQYSENVYGSDLEITVYQYNIDGIEIEVKDKVQRETFLTVTERTITTPEDSITYTIIDFDYTPENNQYLKTEFTSINDDYSFVVDSKESEAPEIDEKLFKKFNDTLSNRVTDWSNISVLWLDNGSSVSIENVIDFEINGETVTIDGNSVQATIEGEEPFFDISFYYNAQYNIKVNYETEELSISIVSETEEYFIDGIDVVYYDDGHKNVRAECKMQHNVYDPDITTFNKELKYESILYDTSNSDVGDAGIIDSSLGLIDTYYLTTPINANEDFSEEDYLTDPFLSSSISDRLLTLRFILHIFERSFKGLFTADVEILIEELLESRTMALTKIKDIFAEVPISEDYKYDPEDDLALKFKWWQYYDYEPEEDYRYIYFYKDCRELFSKFGSVVDNTCYSVIGNEGNIRKVNNDVLNEVETVDTPLTYSFDEINQYPREDEYLVDIKKDHWDSCEIIHHLVNNTVYKNVDNSDGKVVDNYSLIDDRNYVYCIDNWEFKEHCTVYSKTVVNNSDGTVVDNSNENYCTVRNAQLTELMDHVTIENDDGDVFVVYFKDINEDNYDYYVD